MEIKRIYIEAKRSANFNTYTVGFDAEMELHQTFEEIETQIKELQTRARKLANEQIALDKK